MIRFMIPIGFQKIVKSGVAIEIGLNSVFELCKTIAT